MVEVVIKGIVVTHQYGTLSTGDVLRTDAEFAKHLVEDCGAADYRTAQQEPVGEPAAPADGETPAPARRGRAKQ